MPFSCFDLCLTAWREYEIVFHGTVVGAAILNFFATGVFFDDLEVDAFLFGIVTIIALTNFDLPSWNTRRRLVEWRCCVAGLRCWAGSMHCCVRIVLRARVGSRCFVGCVARWWVELRIRCALLGCETRDAGAALAGWCSMLVLRTRGLALLAAEAAFSGWLVYCWHAASDWRRKQVLEN